MANNNGIMPAKGENKNKEVEIKQFKFIGIGAAGNKAVLQLVNRGLVEKQDIVLINSTKEDIPDDYNGAYIALTQQNSGCGKERGVAKEYAVRMLKARLLDPYLKAESIVIVSSIAGGTGSGSTPIIGEYCQKVMGLNTHFIAFCGFEEDPRELQNSLEFFEELNFDCDVQAIKNSAFLKDVGNNKFRAEECANDELCQRVSIMMKDGIIPSKQNIDHTDHFKLINTTGFKTIEKIEFDTDLVDTEAFNKMCKQMIYNSKSLKSEDPGQLRLGVFLNLSPLSMDSVDFIYTVIKEAYGKPYEQYSHVQWDGKKQFIAFISSGMKLPIDEVKQMQENYLVKAAQVNNSKDEFFEELSKLEKGNNDTFNMVRTNPVSSTSADSFFKSLETKPTPVQKK